MLEKDLELIRSYFLDEIERVTFESTIEYGSLPADNEIDLDTMGEYDEWFKKNVLFKPSI